MKSMRLWPTLFLNSPRRAPSLSRRNPGSCIPLLCPTRPPEASFFGGGGRWALALALAARRQSLTQSLRRLYPGQKKQQHNTELVGWFVACFFKSHAAQQRHWFGQLAISHIKQQVVCPCSHTIKHGSKVKTKRLSFVASFPIHFEPRFEPLGWLCALYSSAAGRKNRSRGSFQ